MKARLPLSATDKDGHAVDGESMNCCLLVTHAAFNLHG